ncbi:MAG: amidohydrolase [Candidatus Bathyarchaeota archaeon]|nr:amidohydrolase [Candidatus Bathyarchaeota archaeon]
MAADLVLLGGNVLTMNHLKPQAEAIAIKGGHIIKVGSDREVKPLIGKATRVIELNGKTVLPGFIDTHVHVVDFARLLMWLDVTDVDSIAELQRRIKEHLYKSTLNDWIVGRGWDDTRFAEQRMPNRFDLDAVAPDNPVIMYYKCGPLCVVNSKALELAAITKTTPDPIDGIIDRDVSTCEPTGILRGTATNLVFKKVPEPTFEKLVETTALALQKIVSTGITTIHWLATSEVDLDILKHLAEKKQVPLYIYLVIPLSLMGPQISKLPQNDFVKIGGVEILVDGYLSSGTAALSEQYSNAQSMNTNLLCTNAQLKETIKKVVNSGLQVIIHAMGDKAIDVALNALEAVNVKSRPRIDQPALFNPNLIERLKNQNVVLSVQPVVGESEFTVYAAIERLGKERARWLYPLKTLFESGIYVCGGSDCPMEPLNPLLAIQSAVKRQFFPEEELTLNEALQMYTINAAYASNEENKKGSIEEHKQADLTILSEPLYTLNLNKISNISVERVIIRGKLFENT